MTSSTQSQGSNVKSSVIIDAVKADPTLLAPVAGVDTSKYDISFQASYVLNSKQVQYKSILASLNGSSHRIVEINGVFAKAVAVVPTTVAYLVDDGILGVVYSTVDKSLANLQSTTTDATTGETIPTTTDSSNVATSAAVADSTVDSADTAASESSATDTSASESSATDTAATESDSSKAEDTSSETSSEETSSSDTDSSKK